MTANVNTDNVNVNVLDVDVDFDQLRESGADVMSQDVVDTSAGSKRSTSEVPTAVFVAHASTRESGDQKKTGREKGSSNWTESDMVRARV
jgi:hypothetical protein